MCLVQYNTLDRINKQHVFNILDLNSNIIGVINMSYDGRHFLSDYSDQSIVNEAIKLIKITIIKKAYR